MGHVPLAVGTILSQGDAKFLENWRRDLDIDATGRNIYEYVIDKVDEQKEEEVLDAGVYDGSSDMGGGSGIVTASQRVGAEREPNPEVAARE